MTSIIKFSDTVLAIRDFEGIPREDDRTPVNFLVFIDLATPLASEIEHVRARWARKLVALLRPNDRLTLWWFSSSQLFGSFIHNQVIADPTKEIPDLLEKFITVDTLKSTPVGLAEMVAKVNHLYVESSERKEALVGYTDVEGFMMQSAQEGLFTLLANVGRFLRLMFLCEYSSGDTVSSFFVNGGNVLGRKLLLGKDQTEEQITFELAARNIAADKMAEVNISRASPPEDYGFVLFLYDNQPLLTPCSEDDVILLPGGVNQFAYFSDEVPADAMEFMPQLDNSPLVWVALALAEIADEDIDVEALLTAVGDVYLGNHYVEGFHDEDYCRYELACLEAAFDARMRYRQGVTQQVAELSNVPASEVEDMLAHAIEKREEMLQREVADKPLRNWLTYLVYTVKYALPALAACYLGYHYLIA